MYALTIAWFIPSEVYLLLGTIELPPRRVVGIFAFVVFLARRRYRFTQLDLLAASTFAAYIFSTAINAGIMTGLEAGGRYSIDYGSVYLAGRCIGAAGPQSVNKFLSRLAVSMAFFALALPIESWTRTNFFHMIWQVEYNPFPEFRWGLQRAHGWAQHPIMLGLSYACIFPWVLNRFLDQPKSPHNALVLLAVTVGVFCSLSAGAYGMVAVTLLLMAWDRVAPLAPKIRWVGFWSMLGAMLAVAKLVTDTPLLMIIMYRARFLSNGYAYRFQLYERIYAVMPGHWLFGYGPNFPPAFSGPYASSIDNHYLVLMLYSGYLGHTLWLLFNWAMVWKFTQTVFFQPDSPITREYRVFGITLLGIMFAAVSVFLFSFGAFMVWLFIGLTVGICQFCRRELDTNRLNAHSLPGSAQ